MSIKGITDRPASFPEIGAIRKGAPKGERQPGKDLTYFRVEFDEREAASAAVFAAKYGETPDELNILLPFNEVDRNFDAWREAYLAGAMLHRCNGEYIQYEIDHATGEKLVIGGVPEKKCNGRIPVTSYTNSKGKIEQVYCRPVGRLKVLIPELQRLAFLTVHTTSIHDCIFLSSQLAGLYALNGGRLAGIPLKLRRRPMEISTPSGENGKRARRKKWLLSIEADPKWVKAGLLELKRSALPGNGLELPQIEAPHTQSVEGPEWDEDVVEAGKEEEEPQAHPDVDTEMARVALAEMPDIPDGHVLLPWRGITTPADAHPDLKFDGPAILAIRKAATALAQFKTKLKEVYQVDKAGDLLYGPMVEAYGEAVDILADREAA